MEQEYKYTVCTWCFTYNQASYIEEALNSFAMQQTSFPVVNVIIDDSSTDNEQVVLQKWAVNNLDFTNEGYSCSIDMPYGKLVLGRHKGNSNSDFAILLLKENHYQSGRDKDRYAYMSEWTDNAKYLAICEGDDYWIDPFKLQKQVKALESHPQVDMCACAAIKITTGEKDVGKVAPYDYDYLIPLEDVVLGGGGYVATNTLMYRSTIHKSNALWRQNWLDYFLQIAGALRGGLYYLSDCMAVYRYMAVNSWSSSMYKQYGRMYDHEYLAFITSALLDAETDYKYTSLLKRMNIDTVFALFRYGVMSNKFSAVFKRMAYRTRLKFIVQVVIKVLFP